MQLPKSVRENLYFLLAETASQVANLQVLTETASSTVAQRILDRRGYSYNLKMRVHDDCLTALRRAKKGDIDGYSLRAAEATASGLERLSDICQDCVRLMGNLRRKDALGRYGSATLLKGILNGLDAIERAIDRDEPGLVLQIGNIERKLDRSAERVFRKQVEQLPKKKHPEDGVTALLLVHRIEEMGDVLLEVAESIVSAKLGQPMHLDRFKSLNDALDDLGLDNAAVEQIAETKSGSGVSGISDRGKAEGNGYAAIFKDGKKDKLNEEREKVEGWHEIFPGLAPQIISYKKKGKNASLLIEHLPGLTFEQILLQADDAVLAKAQKRLHKTVRAVWEETRRKKVVPAEHMMQLRKRLDSVLQVHPEFDLAGRTICGQQVSGLSRLINDAGKLEAKIEPPFSVFIHGDFNLDNVLFDPDSKDIRFIDLHRSRYMDYVQDVAVFMVSNYRLQVMDPVTRARVAEVAHGFYDFARDYAKSTKDQTFEVRLALGLARSFLTSTRFILDKALAGAMMRRGIYVLERLQCLDKKRMKSFRLPIKDLFS